MRFSSRFLILAISGVAASLAAVPALATMPPPPGRIPPAARAVFERGLRLPPPFRTKAGLCPPPLATWHIPIILAAFADDTLTYAPADFDSALFGTRQAISTGSVREYYHWASGGRVDVTGRVVARVRLPQTLAYYGDDYWGRSGRSISSTCGAIRDALRICQGAVDWSEFDLNHDGAVDILWFIHAGRGGEASLSELPARDRLWSFTDGLSSDPGGPGPFETSKFLPGSTTQYYKIDRFSCLPEMSGLIPGRRSEIYFHPRVGREPGPRQLVPDVHWRLRGERDSTGVPCSSRRVGLVVPGLEREHSPGAGHDPPSRSARGRRAGGGILVPGRIQPRALPAREPHRRRFRPLAGESRHDHHPRGRGADRVTPPARQPGQFRPQSRAGPGRGRWRRRPPAGRRPRRQQR
ncbi:MAG: hypothetical protein E6K72_07070 [Candidatus Eisenbacteria bacterium]|uniref:Peptidase M6-like domain-containing protein n=1 Tax=Eiseniibacteriota bacterium TaxID=2212470 RepID=A0A538SU95_UNCEI|nr:MAG: hypothetical protein E6K72_07070 [Candidatus Eisenbacteria bacterium]